MEKLKSILGGNASVPRSSPLGCLLAHWKEGCFGQELRKGKLVDYCNVWWPQYELEDQESWPENGTLQYNTILQLMLFCKRKGKWDEIPYVELFFYLRDKPEWQRACGIMVAKITVDEHCKGCRGERRCIGHQALENDRYYRRDDGNIDLEVVPSAPLEQGQTVREGSGDSEGEEEENGAVASATPVSYRTRQREQKVVGEWMIRKKGGIRQKGNIIAPLRQGVGTEGPVYVKVPFTPGDLVIWKQAAGTYRENPDKVARVMKMIIKTQNPDWDDLQVILDTLMDSTEKDTVLRAARERAKEDVRNGLVSGSVDQNFPTEDPQWDYNTGDGLRRLKRYQDWIQIGVQSAMPKTINWSKLYNVRQEKTESPSAFLERLKETAKKYTDLDIETEQAKAQLALIFLGQSQEDIRKKLQKLEGGDLRNMDRLLEIAWKVYNNREKESTRRQQQNLLAVIQGRGNQGFRGRGRGFARGRGVSIGRGRGDFGGNPGERLGLNQCA
uniref:Core shell protein Gag P30 domain-containing protein n=1 Tax=Anser cygnoides TaxID=8845 RepID=A0A8B9EJJ4_ANSCY